MTPQEYREVCREQELIIDAANLEMQKAYRRAEMCPVPENLRPATAADVVEGAIIWKPKWPDDGRKWSIVESVEHPDDNWKAWTDNGCRYGLENAFVENAESRLVRWWFNFRHDTLGWHNCKGGIGKHDGCSQHARCSCGKEVMQDSQGNWF